MNSARHLTRSGSNWIASSARLLTLSAMCLAGCVQMSGPIRTVGNVLLTDKSPDPERPPVVASTNPADHVVHNTPTGYWVGRQPPWRERARAPYFPNAGAGPVEWPQAPPQGHNIDLTRRDRATAVRYFNWLCENDAIVDIRRKVEGVEGLFFMRPQLESMMPYETGTLQKAKGNEGQMPYALNYDRNFLESPAVLYSGNKDFPFSRLSSFHQKSFSPKEKLMLGIDDASYSWLVTDTYPFIERVNWENSSTTAPRFFRLQWELPMNARIVQEPGKSKRYLLLPAGHQPAPRGVQTNELRSRYGVSWRGVARSIHDRDLGIAGGEIIVMDLQKNEVLGVMRTYVISGNMDRNSSEQKEGINWGYGVSCKPRSALYAGIFWETVLTPKGF